MISQSRYYCQLKLICVLFALVSCKTRTEVSNAPQPGQSEPFKTEDYNADITKKEDSADDIEFQAASTNGVAQPCCFKLTATDVRFNLSWGRVTGVSGYKIFRGTNAIAMAEVASTTSTSWRDTTVGPGETRFYYVQAWNASGLGTPTATLSASNRANSPTNVRAISVQQRIRLDWDLMPVAANYRIYRGTSATRLSHVASVGSGTNTWVDGALDTKKTYYYQVTSLNAAGESPRSPVVQVRPGSITLVNLMATVDVQTVKISWPPRDNVTGYRVYRRQGSGKAARQGDTTGLEYIQSQLPPQTDYTYYVNALINGVEIPHSNSTPVKTGGSLPPERIKLSLNVGVDRVTLSYNRITDAQGYRIERRGDVGEFKEIATSSVLSWTDTGVTPGLRYFYRVTGYRLDGQFSVSNEASGVPGSVAASDVRFYRGKSCSGESFAFANTQTSCEILASSVAGNVESIKTGSRCLNTGTVSFLSACNLFKAGSDNNAAELYSKTDCSASAVLGFVNQTTNCQALGQVVSGNPLVLSVSYIDSSTCKPVTSQSFVNACSNYRLRPPVLTASNFGDSIGLTWSTTIDAQSYSLYRRAEDEVAWTRVTETSNNSWVERSLRRGVSYSWYVNVQARNGGYVSSNIVSERLVVPDEPGSGTPREVALFRSDSCTGSALAFISQGTNCEQLVRQIGNDAVWGVRVGGVCKNIQDTSLLSGCERFKGAVTSNSVALKTSSNCGGEPIAYVSSQTECSNLSGLYTGSIYSGTNELTGQCTTISSSGIVQACNQLKPTLSGASLALHSSSNCSGNPLALFDETANCDEIGSRVTSTVYGVSVRGQCRSISGSSAASACQRFKAASNSNAVALFQSSSCGSSYALGYVSPVSNCSMFGSLVDSTVYGIDSGSGCRSIDRTSSQNACDLYKNSGSQARRVELYSDSSCSNRFLGAIDERTDCSRISSTITAYVYGVKRDNKCYSISKNSREACQAFKGGANFDATSLFQSYTCSQSELSAFVSSNSNCESVQAGSPNDYVYAIQNSGSCTRVDSTNVLQACNLYRFRGGSNQVELYRSDTCASSLVGTVRENTDCEQFGATNSSNVYAVRIGSRCVDIADTTSKSACYRFRDGYKDDATIVYRSDTCNGNAQAVIAPTTNCSYLSQFVSGNSWAVGGSSRCEDIYDMDFKQACERYKNTMNGVGLYESDTCSYSYVGAVALSTDCQSFGSNTAFRLGAVKRRGESCLDVDDRSLLNGCVSFKAGEEPLPYSFYTSDNCSGNTLQAYANNSTDCQALQNAVSSRYTESVKRGNQCYNISGKSLGQACSNIKVGVVQ